MSVGSPLAAWRRVEVARPLVAWREAQLAAVARALERALHAWSEAWALPSPPGGVTCTEPTEQDGRRGWECVAAGAAGAVWLCLPASFGPELERLLWGCDGVPGPIARRVLATCRADFQGRLRTALHIEAPGDPALECVPASCPWSGQVVAALAPGAFLLLDAKAMGHLLRLIAPELAGPAAPAAARAPLTPLATALAGRRLALRARLADCQLDLASLQELCIGDIVPLPHRLDAPLQVCDAQGQVVLGGYLARRGQRKALELAVPAERAAPPF